MKKKVVVFGGGNGLSTLLSGLKEFPVDITAIVSVSDDGKSTGRLREEFNIPAMGDVRRVLISLSEVEPIVEKLMNYRFQTTSDLDGHTVGNLMLTALTNITGNMSDSIEVLGNVFNLKGKVLPLTEDNVVLMAHMKDGKTIEGEHIITDYPSQIQDLFYKEEPVIPTQVLEEIRQADMIILSMGSLFTSVICNLISKDVIQAIDESHAKILYVCNIMTQPGETDDFTVSDHVETLNRYLGKNKITDVIVNTGEITPEVIEKYAVEEQKDPVVIDYENLKDVRLIEDQLVKIIHDQIHHDVMKLGLDIYSTLM
ncbi:MAG TPA: YvcK family protein [Candidatus Pelethosoma merdigallinarum]|nr:YvcK family protein [Candidatus Pelethosoma merdigallinarum]